MDKRKFSIIVLIIGLAIAIVAMIWQAFINKGTLEIETLQGATVTVDQLEAKTCDTIPCSWTGKPGVHAITIEKDGYQTVEKIITLTRGKMPISITLEKVPTVSELETKDTFTPPEEKTQPHVTLSMVNGNQALVDTDTKEVIVYFSRPLASSILTANTDRKKIYIMDTAQTEKVLYMIDATAHTRTAVATITDTIKTIISSPKGKSIIVTGETKSLWINTETHAQQTLPTRLDSKKLWSFDGENAGFFVTSDKKGTHLYKVHSDDIAKPILLNSWDVGEETIEKIVSNSSQKELWIQGKNKNYHLTW